MDYNRILIWMVVLSCLVTLFRLLRIRLKILRYSLLITSSILFLILLGLFIIPEAIGYVATAVWLLLVLVPGVAAKSMQRWILQQKYERAWKMSLILRWFQPVQGWRDQARIFHAMALAEKGQQEQAKQLLSTVSHSSSPARYSAAELYFRINHQWTEYLEWLGKAPGERLPRNYPNLLSSSIRAQGETGDLNGMLRVFAQNEKYLFQPELAVYKDLSLLAVFAFCGREEVVKRLLQGRLRFFSEEIKLFWRATASLTQGEYGWAGRQFSALLQSANRLTRAASERRLQTPLADPKRVLSDESREILTRLEREIEQDARYGESAGRSQGRPNFTYVLIGLNLGVFALEILNGGSTDLKTLYRMGALELRAVLGGEWWRVLSSTFLHFGYLHLLMNMFGLYLIGPFLEYTLGVKKYLVLYLISGIGSMSMLILVHGLIDPAVAPIFLGASGSIMGLIGGTAAILLQARLKQKSFVLTRRLTSMGLIVLLQVIFDLMNPEVSFTAHLSGVIIGFILVILIGRVPQEDESKT